MNPEIRELVNRLDDRLGHLSSQMEEMRENVRSVVVVAEADPEMALTKARKVLESVLRRVWEHFIPNEPIGTRPLEEILQRLQKNGYLPRKQGAYAIAVKELGNVGTHVHDEKVDKADVVQALSPLISVLEWYFEQDWVDGAVPANQSGPTLTRAPRRNRDPVALVPRPDWKPRHFIRLGVGLAVMLTVAIVAGLFATLRGRTAPPIHEKTPVHDTTAPPIADTSRRSDQERIQGRWHPVQVFDAIVSTKNSAKTKKIIPSSTPDWEFQGGRLTMHLPDNVSEFRGSFSLNPSSKPKSLDFVGTNPKGESVEFVGIYEFEGEFLKVSWRTRRNSNDASVKRPDSFAIVQGTSLRYRKFLRLGDRK